MKEVLGEKLKVVRDDFPAPYNEQGLEIPAAEAIPAPVAQPKVNPFNPVRQPYQRPPAPFKPGQLIWWQGDRYKVIASSHTHTQLEGVSKAVWNFDLVGVCDA